MLLLLQYISYIRWHSNCGICIRCTAYLLEVSTAYFVKASSARFFARATLVTRGCFGGGPKENNDGTAPRFSSLSIFCPVSSTTKFFFEIFFGEMITAHVAVVKWRQSTLFGWHFLWEFCGNSNFLTLNDFHSRGNNSEPLATYIHATTYIVLPTFTYTSPSCAS